MSRINVPDPQLIERDALDDAFDLWYQHKAGNIDPDNSPE